MLHDAPPALRRFWAALWGLTAALLLLLLFATLTERPYDVEALRHFPLEVLERGRRFSREATVAGTMRAFVSLGMLLFLCFHPVGARVLTRLERWGRGRWWLSLLLVALGLTALTTAVELPFDYYLGYLHERAYGLTRQSPVGWLHGYLKGMALQLAIALPLWAALYGLIRRSPRNWWVPAAALNIAFSGLLTLLYPVLIMPMLNTMAPVHDPEVLRMVHHLSDKAGVKVESVRQIVVSPGSSRVNAMVTGLWKTKQVIFYDTLLQQFHPAEVEVVMAHELAHAVHDDVTTNWLVSGGVEVLSLLLAAWMLRSMVGVAPLRLPHPGSPRGLALFLLMSILIGQVTAPVHNTLSRRMEVRADRFALEVTGNPEAFISSFKKLARGNPADVDPPALVELLSYSHPSVMRRIRMATEQMQ